ncbi:MAG: retropepsin-like aspartic protease [Rubrivivax sp.]
MNGCCPNSATARRRTAGTVGALAVAHAFVATIAVAVAAGPASAAGVLLSGRMGDRALLVIDGAPRTVALGQSTAGVQLLRWLGDDAEIERDGVIQRLSPGGSAAVAGTPAARTGPRQAVLAVGPGGHFVTTGAINGRPVPFMVDTGATLVAMGRDQADRLGIDLTHTRTATTMTANGPVRVHLVTLNTVRVGDIELVNVGAAIVPQPMPMVLLGNSFLSRLQMRRDNDSMLLQMR